MLGFSLSILFSIIAFYYDKDICEKLIGQSEMDMDMNDCMEWYIKTAVTMVICLGISCLIDVNLFIIVVILFNIKKKKNFF